MSGRHDDDDADALAGTTAAGADFSFGRRPRRGLAR